MGVLIKTRDQLLSEMLDALRDRGLLTNLSPTRAAFILSQVHASHLGELYQALEANFSQAFISSASGPFLDLIAELFGLFRFPQQAAISLSTESNVRFFVTSGTLASKITSKTISAGTLISNTAGTVSYQVLETVMFNDVTSEVFVSVISEGVGPTQNVGKNELDTHDLGIADVLVTNDVAIDTATDIENDPQFRARLSDASLTRATSNTASIREAAVVVPGVSDVRIAPFRNGPGTVEMTIIPVSNSLNPRTESLVRASVNVVRGAGTIVDIRGPRFVSVEITILLRFTQDTPLGQKPNLRQGAQQAILDYLEELRLGQAFIIKEMIQRVLDTSDRILDFEIRCFAFRRRAQALRNFIPDPDELLIPDPTLEQPIRAL